MGDSLKSVAGNYMRRKEGRKRRTIKKVLLFSIDGVVTRLAFEIQAGPIYC